MNLNQLTFTEQKAKEFQVIDGKVMPSFSAIEGMGDKAAEMLEAAAKDGKIPFKR